MHAYPHQYTVLANAEPTGDVPLDAPGLPPILISNSVVAQRRPEPTVIAG